VVALLHGVEGLDELEEGFVAGAFAGKADEGGDGEAEGLEVDVGAVAADDFEGLEAAEALGGGGWREADAAAELGDGEAGVGGELAEELTVEGVEYGEVCGLELCSWFVVRGSWFVVRGSWFVVRG
jgi:hypothetical protein